MVDFFKRVCCFLFFFITCAKADTIVDETIFVPSSNTELLSTEEFDLYNSVNSFRIDNDFPPLRSDSFLYNLALIRNEEFKKIDTVTHAGLGVIRNEAYEYELIIGENIAFGYYDSRSAFNAFISSEDHRNNILGNWTYTGVVVDTDEHGHKFYTQVFARRVE